MKKEGGLELKDVLGHWEQFALLYGMNQECKDELSAKYDEMAKFIFDENVDWSSYDLSGCGYKAVGDKDYDLRVFLFAVMRRMYGKMVTMRNLLDNPKELVEEVCSIIKSERTKEYMDMLRASENYSGDDEAELCVLCGMLMNSKRNDSEA